MNNMKRVAIHPSGWTLWADVDRATVWATDPLGDRADHPPFRTVDDFYAFVADVAYPGISTLSMDFE